jgi:DNA-binding beta-propeller fold protein YncE
MPDQRIVTVPTLIVFVALMCSVSAEEPKPPSRVGLADKLVATPAELGGKAHPPSLRHPVAAVWLDEGRTLCIANHRSGSLSLVDVAAGKVVSETTVGKRLADLAVLPDRRHVLAVDDAKHELIILSHDRGQLHVDSRQPVSPYPISVAVSSDGSRAVVASLWSRRLHLIDLRSLGASEPVAAPRLMHELRLPFAPRRMLWLPGTDDVVVADAFGGRLAIVDARLGQLVALQEIDGHNLQGLALSADGLRLLVTHQRLKETAPVTQDSIHWGETMANLLGEIPLSDLRNPRLDLRQFSQLTFLGTRETGAGDPAGIAVLDQQSLAVALSGVDELGIVENGGLVARRIPVGRRPLVVVPPGKPESTPDSSSAASSRNLIVVNSLDDSLSVVDSRAGKVVREIALGPKPELTAADRGERLFFDSRLSHDGWLSCHSCHTNGHTNGLRADTLGDNSYGAPKRTPTLLGTALTDKWAWNGSFQYLHEQIQKSLKTTLRTENTDPQTALDLSAFLHTLPPPPPTEPATSDKSDQSRIERGQIVFREHGCGKCHVPPINYTSHEVHDVGLTDEHGQTKFNAPSLRGVSQLRRFFHDNRASSLEDVFLEFNHPRATVLDDDELADLLRFLRSL